MVETKNQIENATKNYINIQEFVCGWSASFINISVTYPVYKIMFRQVSLSIFVLDFILLFFLKKNIFISDVAWRGNKISDTRAPS